MLQPARDDLRPQQQGGVSLWYIATRLGCGDRSAQWVANYVRQLVDDHKFPKPFPPCILRKQRRAEVGLHSRWLRSAVDAWLDGFMPEHLAPIAEDAALRRDAELLDNRADALAGGQCQRRDRPELAPAATGAR